MPTNPNRQPMTNGNREELKLNWCVSVFLPNLNPVGDMPHYLNIPFGRGRDGQALGHGLGIVIESERLGLDLETFPQEGEGEGRRGPSPQQTQCN